MRIHIGLIAQWALLVACAGCSAQSDPKPRASTNAGSPAITSAANFKTALFTSADACAKCHNGIRDQASTDVSVQLDWSSTMMAQSATDPLFVATLAKEIARFPNRKLEIEQHCSRCHAPMAALEADAAHEPIALTGAGFLNASHRLHPQALEGVGCTLCHKIAGSSVLGTASGFSGNFSLDNTGLLYGGWPNADTSPMFAATGYSPVYGPHTQRSSFCATCHELTTPVRDADGNPSLDPFPAQTVFTEWQNSTLGQTGGKSCQQCHMPDANGVIASSNQPERLVARDGFSRHLFVGGNAFMLDMLGANRQELGISANNFAQTSARARALLATSATIDISGLKWNGTRLEFSVGLFNKTGHKFPTGYPSRRAFVHVTVADNAGHIVFESGKTNADGSIQGVDGVAGRDYTPHYLHITAAEQVPIFEAVMADAQGKVTYSQFQAASYVKDNRLLPEGYSSHLAPATIRPDSVTRADSDFLGGSEHVHYRLDGLAVTQYVVTAELNYQALSWPALNDLISGSDNDATIGRFKQLNQSANAKIETVAKTSAQIN